MDYQHDSLRAYVEGDRLSNLPDDIIYNILSFISIKHAIGTSVLSSRWRNLWTSMPYLNFSTEDSHSGLKFSKFVKNVLSLRNNQIGVSSIKLDCESVNWIFAKRILGHAFCHNIQQVTITCLHQKPFKFPVELFKFESPEHLTLNGLSYAPIFTPASSWDLLALTTLHLDYVTLHDDNSDNCVGLFSKCINLKNLELNHCKLTGSDGFIICHPRLCNLILDNGDWRMKVVDVVTPQLKNLTIRNCIGEHWISAPNLAFLVYRGHYPLQFCAKGFCSLVEVDLFICNPYNEEPCKIIGLLRQLHNVKYLTLNSEIFEFLWSYMELISREPFIFDNLKSLKIYQKLAFCKVQETMFAAVNKYFLEGSTSAVFRMVSLKETRATRNTEHAQNLMKDLQLLLEHEKVNNWSNMINMDQMKAQDGNQKVQLCMTHINSCWDNMYLQIEQKKTKTSVIISKLQDIEGLMTELPASKRAKIEASFSSLLVEANIVINEIIECMKIQCNED